MPLAYSILKSIISNQPWNKPAGTQQTLIYEIQLFHFRQHLFSTDFDYSEKEGGQKYRNLIWDTKFRDFRKKVPYFRSPIMLMPRIVLNARM